MVDELEGASVDSSAGSANEEPTASTGEAEANPMPPDPTEPPAEAGLSEPPAEAGPSAETEGGSGEPSEVLQPPSEPEVEPAGISLIGTSREADGLALATYKMGALRNYAADDLSIPGARKVGLRKDDLIGMILDWVYLGPPAPAPVPGAPVPSESASVRVQRIQDSQRTQ